MIVFIKLKINDQLKVSLVLGVTHESVISLSLWGRGSSVFIAGFFLP